MGDRPASEILAERRDNMAARPRRNRLAWSVSTYRLVIRGRITEDEADRRTDAPRGQEQDRSS